MTRSLRRRIDALQHLLPPPKPPEPQDALKRLTKDEVIWLLETRDRLRAKRNGEIWMEDLTEEERVEALRIQAILEAPPTGHDRSKR
jgi:hypothetical protein